MGYALCYLRLKMPRIAELRIFLAIVAFASFWGAGCVPSGEGQLDIRDEHFFTLGENEVGESLPAPTRGVHIAKFSIEKQNAEESHAIITVESIPVTYVYLVNRIQCRNMQGSLIRCDGTMPSENGVEIVTWIEGKTLKGLQLWRLPRDSDSRPRIIATFGLGSNMTSPSQGL